MSNTTPGSTGQPAKDHTGTSSAAQVAEHGWTNGLVAIFLRSNLSVVLILLAVLLGLMALWITPREEDPQIVVPMADVHVQFPGRSAEEVEQLVATPLEKLLWEIDGVEHVYSMSRTDAAIITVRFFVGQDRERSLVKLYKRIDEHIDRIPPGVTGWVVKPIEIDDVPIVTFTLTSAASDGYTLRRVGEEIVQRLAGVRDVSRAYVIGGQPRVVYVRPDAERIHGYGVDLLGIKRAFAGTHARVTAGQFERMDAMHEVEAGQWLADAAAVRAMVVGVSGDRPVFLGDVAEVIDGPAEVTSYVRHGWGPAAAEMLEHGAGSSVLGAALGPRTPGEPQSAVTIAISKKKGSNAVRVADAVMAAMTDLKQEVIPSDMDVVITRNYGLTADHKVNELIEALAIAVIFVIAVLALGLGWREAWVVAVAVPVVFGLTLTVNLLAGFTINRVTLFALILSLGLLVDDPIVDVENITRHFGLHRRATPAVVLEAVAEIRPPLITATLAVIVSFLPMSFITGMMGPYMRPMALNVPVAMLMSMLVAFTITPWLSYHLLRKRYAGGGPAQHEADPDDPEAIKRTLLYRLFYPIMAPLLASRARAVAFLVVIALLTVLAAALAATRHVPLKMLPFDNKNELLFVLDLPEATTLERSDAAVRAIETELTVVPELVDYTSYVGLASPMDFNGLVRHYYLRGGSNVAEVRVNLAGKKERTQQSHTIALRLRDHFTQIAADHGAILKIVETPPGPPVIASVVAEVTGRPDHSYADLMSAARCVAERLDAEPGVVEVDTSMESDRDRRVFTIDQEKAALNGVNIADAAATLRMALSGEVLGALSTPDERQPLLCELRLPRPVRSDTADLARLYVRGQAGSGIPLAEIGTWEKRIADRTLYHKDLQRVVYVFAETAGRPPADVVVDVQADRRTFSDADVVSDLPSRATGSGLIAERPARPVEGRTFLSNGSGVLWALPDGLHVNFAGEGEWQITLDVFRDLGLAFAAALVGIYVLLVGQLKSFVLPMVVMLAIPLTVLGIMPGFWLLNVLSAGTVGGYSDPVFFTATGMIGMIALAGIVTRDSIILVDFIHLAQARGRSLFDAIMESRVVRLRPILLTAATAMLASVPITIDPIFSGLAWALIFGLLASTVFTLFVIPVAYWLVYSHRELPRRQLPARPAA